MTHRDSGIVGDIDSVGSNRLIEIDQAIFHQLHDQRCRYGLRNRGKPEGRMGVCFDLTFDVGITEAGRPHEVPVLYDRRSHTRDTERDAHLLEIGRQIRVVVRWNRPPSGRIAKRGGGNGQ